jgi:capsular polysaccharide biosynthesis protein
LRFVENENEVVALLEKYGFKKIIAEKFSYDEQIAICYKAKYLLSPHGAGLTNLLFMKENSSVLELASAPSSQKLVTDYYKLASMLNINYFYQECEMAESSKVKDFHHASLLVNLEKLEKNLKLMLKND